MPQFFLASSYEALLRADARQSKIASAGLQRENPVAF